MSEAKFAKGSWYLSGDARGGETICAINKNLGIKVSEIPDNDPIHDAYLIAAAPEMYRMLEVCSEILKLCDLHNASRDIDDILSKARGEK